MSMKLGSVVLVAILSMASVRAYAGESKTYSCKGSSFMEGNTGPELKMTLTFEKSFWSDSIGSAHAEETDGYQFHGATMDYHGSLKSNCKFETVNSSTGEHEHEEPCLNATENSMINPFGDFAYLGFKDWRGTKYSELQGSMLIEIQTLYGSLGDRKGDILTFNCQDVSNPILSFTANSFHYDSATGKCLNATGQEGLNHPDLSSVFQFDQGGSSPSNARTISNKDLECADLSSINFRGTLHSDASYVELVNWNLKGARLSQSDVKWMVFVGGSVDGVDFTKGTLGYTMFRSVQIDSFTHGLSDFCVSTAEQGLIHCQM